MNLKKRCEILTNSLLKTNNLLSMRFIVIVNILLILDIIGVKGTRKLHG